MLSSGAGYVLSLLPGLNPLNQVNVSNFYVSDTYAQAAFYGLNPLNQVNVSNDVFDHAVVFSDPKS